MNTFFANNQCVLYNQTLYFQLFMPVFFYSIICVIIVSLISLIGIFALSIKEKFLRRYLSFLVSLAVGALLGDAFIHLIPEAFNKGGNQTLISVGIIVGIFIFFVLEKILHWHHHHDLENHSSHPLGSLVFVSDGIHNFIDGLIIGTSFLAGIDIGIATTIAVILHEIPQEIGDFGILLHAGYTRMRALWLNFLSALLAVLGVIVSFLLGEFATTFEYLLLPLAAGGFIYIAMSDLIPELQKVKEIKYSLIQLAIIATGVGSMILLLILNV
jgi:zinc and cadmium transporter